MFFPFSLYLSSPKLQTLFHYGPALEKLTIFAWTALVSSSKETTEGQCICEEQLNHQQTHQTEQSETTLSYQLGLMFCQVPTNWSWPASTMAGSQPRRGAWLLAMATSGHQSPVEQLLSSPHQIPSPLVSWCNSASCSLTHHFQAENSSAGDWRTPEPAEIPLNTLTTQNKVIFHQYRSIQTT